MYFYTNKNLKAWGVQIVERPDIFDGRNRCVTVVINEKIDDVAFIDPLTLTMSTDQLDALVANVSANVCEEFMELFIRGINIYAKGRRVVMKDQVGTKWWKDALDRVECILDIYGLKLERLTKLDYERCLKHFGSKRAFNQLIIDAIAYNINDFPKCLICKHCKCKRNGIRVCNRIFTPVDEGNGVKTLRMITDYPISNRISDIEKTFQYNSDCELFEQNPSDIIDWMVRFRNAHF